MTQGCTIVSGLHHPVSSLNHTLICCCFWIFLWFYNEKYELFFFFQNMHAEVYRITNLLSWTAQEWIDKQVKDAARRAHLSKRPSKEKFGRAKRHISTTTSENASPCSPSHSCQSYERKQYHSQRQLACSFRWLLSRCLEIPGGTWLPCRSICINHI